MTPIQLSFFKITVAIAAVDNNIDDYEARRIRDIGKKMEIPGDIVDQVIKKMLSFDSEKDMVEWLSSDIVAISRQSKGVRQSMLDSMNRSAKNDGDVCPDEASLLKQCMKAWGISINE
ncbi:TerB family tellurite resistance protein [Mariprofundus erugo]|uniref:tellurite resistance TerB family protein n=1 Tax=Mariprofundus erugo TaxID=2528639 RepID=UPI0010FE0AF3|nr:TerB family tellurite resistance protein [Mariprofundus erugo]TLS74456.1 TerB family tellurite resistance protein [Mariprofundus erugo]